MKPGEEFIAQGLQDLAQGRETIPALLVSIGAPRLRRLGVPVPRSVLSSPERRLYVKLKNRKRTTNFQLSRADPNY